MESYGPLFLHPTEHLLDLRVCLANLEVSSPSPVAVPRHFEYLPLPCWSAARPHAVVRDAACRVGGSSRGRLRCSSSRVLARGFCSACAWPHGVQPPLKTVMPSPRGERTSLPLLLPSSFRRASACLTTGNLFLPFLYLSLLESNFLFPIMHVRLTSLVVHFFDGGWTACGCQSLSCLLFLSSRRGKTRIQGPFEVDGRRAHNLKQVKCGKLEAHSDSVLLFRRTSTREGGGHELQAEVTTLNIRI